MMEKCAIKSPCIFPLKPFWSPPPISGYKGEIFTDVTYTFDDPKTYVGPVIKGNVQERPDLILKASNQTGPNPCRPKSLTLALFMKKFSFCSG